ncbi:carbohydrate binding domain-containing protein [Mesobacillus thioparans]|uniref:carbohydrate binding domain-containing protein n=1 Tax=Mesobacillus thioparans TaxID=370439 RepID=UPI0039EEB4D1
MKKTLAILLSAMMILPAASIAAPKDKLGNDELKNKQNKSEWSLVWSDEFSGPEIDRSKWTYDIGNWIVDENGKGITSGWGNNEKEYYTDSNDNAFIDDGKLVIKAKKEQVTDQFGTYDYTSAKLKTKGLFSKKYGRYEIKAKLPTGKGLWPAIWMLPEDDKYGAWAASGEIDIMESWGSRPNTVAGTIHYGEGWPNNKYTGKEFELPKNRGIDKWHTYALEWEPGELRWYVDGELYQTQNKWYSKGTDNAANFSYPAPFDQEFYLVMNLAVGGWFDGEVDETTKLPSQMEVDYVRVYDLKKRDYREPVEPVSGPVELPADAKQPLEDGNLVYDQNYQKPVKLVDQPGIELDPMYWNFVKLPDFGGAGSLEVDAIDGRNFAKTSITTAGTQLYSLQMIQNISLGNGGKYKVSFDAKSNAARNMMVKVGAGAERGWVKYSNEESFQLSGELQTYEFTFDMLNETDIASRLEFNLGGNGTNPVWIGNVRVEDITGTPVDQNAAKQPLPNGNHVYNGTFDQGGMDRMMYWNFSGDTAATASVSEDARELHVAIKDGNSDSETVKLDQQGMNLVAGNDYKLSYKARADEPRTIQAALLSEDGTNYSGTEATELTSNMEEYTVEFTMPEDVSDSEAQLVFSFGDEVGDVYLDDVVLLKTSNIPDYGNIDLYPLKNGDFSDGLSSWGNYVHYDASAVISVDNGEAKAAISNEGNETWSVLLEQGNLSLAKGVVYELSFAARSTKERNAEITVENAQYNRYFEKVISLNDEMQQYTYEFTMPADDTASLKMLLGKNDLSPLGAHEVFIDNVVLKVKGAPSEQEPVSTPGIDNGTFADGTTDWNAWWGDQWSGYAEGTMNVENEELKVAISQVGGATYSPQVFQMDLLFEKGSSYTVTFDARADEPRKLNVNIGKELSTDPWFIAYMPTYTVDLTTEMKPYSYTFTMTEETYGDGKIVFELGNILNGNAATNVYLDNVSIIKN